MSITEATPYPLPPPQPQPYPQPRPVMVGLPDIEIAAPVTPPKPARLVSLDIFRGITIAGMLLVNNPGSWSSKYGPLGHADWHGWTPTDLVFPFFLFIVGVAIPFSMAKRSAERHANRFGVFAGIWGRALALVMLGLLLQGLPSANFDALGPERSTLAFMRVAAIWTIGVSFVLLLFPWPSRKLNIVFPVVVAAAFATLAVGIFHANREALESGLPASFNFGTGVLTPWKMRFPGVLQRIGVCYGVAATLALLAPGWRTLLAFAILFCTVYSVCMLRAPYPRHEVGSISEKDNLARRIDEDVFNRYQVVDGERVPVAVHTYGEYPDPEGLLSTLPAIAEVLLGILIGLGLRDPERAPGDKAARVLSWGVFCAVAGVFLGWWLMPINKKIWTPSFTLFTAGMGMLGLGAIYYAADVKGRRAWGWPFKVYGMNAIAAFVFSGILVRILSIVKVTDGHTATKMSVIEFVKLNVANSLHAVEAFCQQHIPKLVPVDTANNISLAYAILFVFAIWLIMYVMYVCRIFLKV